MLLPTIYTSVIIAVFSWSNFVPVNFQIPAFSWPSFRQIEIISPQPPELAIPTSQQHITPTPTLKPTISVTPTKKPTITPTRTLFPTSTPKPTLKVTATPTIKPTAVPTRKPTVAPTVNVTATPTSKPTTSPTSASLDSKQQYILDQINQYRSANGLSSVKADKYTCEFAKTRSEEIVNNFNHDGFSNRSNSKSLPYPSYHNVTENIAMTSDYQQVVTMWKNSSGHAANMRSDTPYVCVAYTDNYYAYEGWRP